MSSSPSSPSSSYCDFEQIIPEPTSVKYRWFNQPIEQIPLWAEDKFQILVHPPNGGLHWLTVDQCQQVVTCIEIDGDNIIQATLKDIVPIKIFDVQNPDACDVDMSDCCSSSSSSSPPSSTSSSPPSSSF